jgi:sugar lactone lactonase YvrE
MTEPNGPRTLLTGRGLLESPRWHGDRLYFSDSSAGEVLAVDLAGRSEVIARVRSLPLCTAWLPDGRLLIVSSPDGRLLRREPDGSLVTFADLGRPGWNDIVVDGRGNAYVNGAGFNPMAGEEFRPARLGRPRRRCPGRHLHRRSGRRLVRRRAQPAVRTRHGGRHGIADRQPGPRGFRLYSRRPGRNHAVHPQPASRRSVVCAE